jgi:hypothetical protein
MSMDQVRLPNGEVVTFDEWLHWPLFSTIEFASTAGVRLRAFTYVVGANVPRQGLAARSATPADTNLQAAGRANWDELFRLFSMTYEVFALTDSSITSASPDILVAQAPALSALNLRRLQRDLVAELQVGADVEKPQVKAPFSYYHQGPGPVAYTSGDTIATGVAFSGGTGGDVSWAAQRKFAFPIGIGSDRVISLLTYSDTGPVADLDQNVRLRWYLDGIRRRPLG